MSRASLDYPNIFGASFDPASGITTHEWFDYNPEHADPVVREILDAIYRDFVATRSTKVLVVADRTRGAFSPEIQKFIAEVQFPRFATDTALRFIAAVLPASRIDAAYAQLWKQQLAKNARFVQADFTTREAGLNWLRTVDAAASTG